MDTFTQQPTGGDKATELASHSIASRGIRTSGDFANLMCSLMTNLLDGSVTPVVANAVCNAGGKLLKAVELEHKYGNRDQDGAKRLVLSSAVN